jgi:CRISPR-associated endonuclease/helicase Cas3
MRYDELLAKSPRENRKITLLTHTRQVLEAAATLFGSVSQSSRLGRCWLQFFKLAPAMWPAFHANLLAACALHDWGKANDGFQDELCGKRDSQVIRHEHLSALLIGLPEVTKWLGRTPHLDIAIVLSAVMTHHLKAAYDPAKGRDAFAARLGARKSLRLLRDDWEFSEVGGAAASLGLDGFDPRALPEIWRFEGEGTSIREIRERVKDEILGPLQRDCEDLAPNGSSRKRMLLAVRAALIAADAAGSGLIREGKTITEWIGQHLCDEPRWNGNRIREAIIDRRLAQINEQLDAKNRPPFVWNEFQLACDGLPRRALLLAPCGSGKTLAAWRWMAAQADRNPVNRAIFLYPTRATAKEGFRDYVSWAPEADAALMHGTAAFDLEDMFDNESDPRHGQSYEAERRLFALAFWAKHVFSATVDQFLAFLSLAYGPLCMLPVLVDSVVVVDEVHSFDDRMFSMLKKFLQCFDLPVLCMTATLTQNRQEQLEQECGLAVYDEKPGQLGAIAERPRYRLTVCESREQAVRAVEEALAAERRVLWVVNTVARCHEVLAMFAHRFDPKSTETRLQTHEGFPIYCYHSRFRLVDRVDRHRDIVENMKPSGTPSLGITTQVCEMSLDLDADLLVTEECPVTSLIQRMGRCNRDREARPLATSGQILVYRPTDLGPYSSEDLTGLPEFLEIVRKGDLTQVALESALANVPAPPYDGDAISRFWESGPYAVAAEEDSFREGDDYNRECVLLDEVSVYLKADAERKPGFLLPVPKRWAKARDPATYPEHRRLPRHLSVAVPGHYHELLGYLDQPLDQWRPK